MADITPTIELVGEQNVETAFKSLQAAGTRAFAALQSSAEKLNFSGITSALDRAKSAATSFGSAAGTVRNAVAPLGSAVASTASTVSEMAGAFKQSVTSTVSAGLAIRQLYQAAADARGPMGDMGNSAKNSSGAMDMLSVRTRDLRMGIRLLAAQMVASVAGIIGFAATTADAGTKLAASAAAVGASTETYQRMGYAFKQLTGDGDVFQKVMDTIYSEALKAREAGQATSEAFSNLGKQVGATGIRLIDFSGTVIDSSKGIVATGTNVRGFVGVMEDLARQLAAIPDKLGRVSAASKVFGKEVGTQLVDALAGGMGKFRAYMADLQQLGAIMPPEMIARAKAFSSELTRLQMAVTGIRNAVGDQFMQPLTDVMEELTQSIINNRRRIIEFAQSVRDTVMPIVWDFYAALRGESVKLAWVGTIINGLKGVNEFLGYVKAGFVAIGSVAAVVANAINQAFGTKLSGLDVILTVLASIALAFGGLVSTIFGVVTIFVEAKTIFAGVFATISDGATNASNAISAGFSGAINLIVGAWQGVAGFFSSLWQAIASGASGLWDGIISTWQGAISTITDFFSGIVDAAQQTWDAIVSAASDIWSGIVGAWNAGVASVVQALQPVKDAIQSIIDLWAQVASAVGLASGGPVGQGYATGGPIHGPGTPTSDSVPIWASRDEWIIRARAARFYGSRVMAAINSMRIDPAALSGAISGTVNVNARPRYAFATGGPVAAAAGHPVVLDLGGGRRVGGLSASADTVRDLQKEAARAKLASGGRKPGWA